MATSAAAVKEEPATKFAKDQLKAIIERIEGLEEEKKTISDDIPRRCAPSCVCASRTKTSAPKRRRFWKPTCRRWECCEVDQVAVPYAGLTRVSINPEEDDFFQETDGLRVRARQ